MSHEVIVNIIIFFAGWFIGGAMVANSKDKE